MAEMVYFSRKYLDLENLGFCVMFQMFFIFKKGQRETIPITILLINTSLCIKIDKAKTKSNTV